MIKVSIDITKIPPGRTREVKRRDGSTSRFLDLILRDRPDDYGNDGFVALSLTREELNMEERPKHPILGNWQRLIAKDGPAPTPRREPAKEDGLEKEDIPF